MVFETNPMMRPVVRIAPKQLTTAEILYHMPDHPSLLQSFVWQTWDRAPAYPRLKRFLDHWRREIDAVIHSIAVAHADEGGRRKWRSAVFEGSLHERGSRECD